MKMKINISQQQEELNKHIALTEKKLEKLQEKLVKTRSAAQLMQQKEILQLKQSLRLSKQKVEQLHQQNTLNLQSQDLKLRTNTGTLKQKIAATKKLFRNIKTAINRERQLEQVAQIATKNHAEKISQASKKAYDNNTSISRTAIQQKHQLTPSLFLPVNGSGATKETTEYWQPDTTEQETTETEAISRIPHRKSPSSNQTADGA